jgi:hypothetical protein
MNQQAESCNFDMDVDTDDLRQAKEELWRRQAKEELLTYLKMAHIRSVLSTFDLGDIITCLGENEVLDHIGIRSALRYFDLGDIITVLGRGDILECIGIEECLNYIQGVGFNPVSQNKNRQICRERVAELAYSFECDS